MTPDELRDRCKVLRNSSASYDGDYMKQEILESLCREMIAEGLERAAGIVWGESEGDINLARFKCRQEAARVKEGKSCSRNLFREHRESSL